MTFEVRIPVPPSKNRLYGRSKTGHIYRRPSYERWRADAGWTIMMQKPKKVEGPYKLTITAPSMRKDLGNIESALSDALQYLGLIDNDRKAVAIIIQQGSSQDVVVKVEEAVI